MPHARWWLESRGRGRHRARLARLPWQHLRIGQERAWTTPRICAAIRAPISADARSAASRPRRRMARGGNILSGRCAVSCMRCAGAGRRRSGAAINSAERVFDDGGECRIPRGWHRSARQHGGGSAAGICDEGTTMKGRKALGWGPFLAMAVAGTAWAQGPADLVLIHWRRSSTEDAQRQGRGGDGRTRQRHRRGRDRCGRERSRRAGGAADGSAWSGGAPGHHRCARHPRRAPRTSGSAISGTRR